MSDETVFQAVEISEESIAANPIIIEMIKDRMDPHDFKHLQNGDYILRWGRFYELMSNQWFHEQYVFVDAETMSPHIFQDVKRKPL